MIVIIKIVAKKYEKQRIRLFLRTKGVIFTGGGHTIMSQGC